MPKYVHTLIIDGIKVTVHSRYKDKIDLTAESQARNYVRYIKEFSNGDRTTHPQGLNNAGHEATDRR